MTDHAVIVPTTFGPAGGIVTEPSTTQRGALVLLQGLGPPARAGVNANWAVLARDLAELGLVVLRFDLAREGDSTTTAAHVDRRGEGWRRSTDLAMLREIAPWFLERAGERELLLVGSCHGGRVALEFAAADPVARGVFLIAPYLWSREPARRDDAGPYPEPVEAGGPTLNTEDQLVEGFRTCLAQGPVWIYVGEPELEQVEPFVRRLERGGGPSFELEVEPGMPLHPVGHPRQQSLVRRHLRERVARALAERTAPLPSAP